MATEISKTKFLHEVPALVFSNVLTFPISIITYMGYLNRFVSKFIAPFLFIDILICIIPSSLLCLPLYPLFTNSYTSNIKVSKGFNLGIIIFFGILQKILTYYIIVMIFNGQFYSNLSYIYSMVYSTIENQVINIIKYYSSLDLKLPESLGSHILPNLTKLFNISYPF